VRFSWCSWCKAGGSVKRRIDFGRQECVTSIVDRLRLTDRQTNSKCELKAESHTLQAQREREAESRHKAERRARFLPLHHSRTSDQNRRSRFSQVQGSTGLSVGQIYVLTSRKDGYVRIHSHFRSPWIAPSVHITNMALHRRHQKAELWYGCLQQCYAVPATTTTRLSGDLHPQSGDGLHLREPRPTRCGGVFCTGRKRRVWS
jgi:hypothetical protein